jgi:hypothetical protein
LQRLDEHGFQVSLRSTYDNAFGGHGNVKIRSERAERLEVCQQKIAKADAEAGANHEN